MASDAQISANRLNAQKSTGPRSAVGKAKSSRNATTHGLTARAVLISGESPEEFAALREQLIVECDPVSVIDWQLVEKLACDFWRLARIPAFEAALYEWERNQDQCDPMNKILAEPVVSLRFRSASGPGIADAEQSYVGRVITALLSRNDVLTKLARHEAHLAGQIRLTLDELRRSRAERTVRDAGDADAT